MSGHLQLVARAGGFVVTDEAISALPRDLTLPSGGWTETPTGQLTNQAGGAELVLRALPHGHFQLVATHPGQRPPRIGQVRVADTVALLDQRAGRWAIEETRQTAQHLAQVAEAALRRGEGDTPEQAAAIADRLERAAALLRELADLEPGPAPLAA